MWRSDRCDLKRGLNPIIKGSMMIILNVDLQMVEGLELFTTDN